LVETNKAEDCLYLNNGKMHYHNGYLTQDYLKNVLNAKAFHLYVLSDDEKNGILKLAGLLKQAHQEKHSDVPSFMENNSKVAYSEDPTLARLISLIGR
jgi:hypothetical protein